MKLSQFTPQHKTLITLFENILIQACVDKN